MRIALDELIVRTITTLDMALAAEEEINLDVRLESLYCRVLQGEFLSIFPFLTKNNKKEKKR